MPLYEYECGACHRRTEKIQKFSDPEITTCPFCGGPLARTITAPAIQFKGAGWYKDLYSSAKPPAAGNASGEGGSTGDAASGSAAPKPDAAPAAPSSAAKSPAATAAPVNSGGGSSGSSSAPSNQ